MTDTATAVTVSNEALAKAYDVLQECRDRGLELGQASANIVYDTAPLIIAAYLRKMAAEQKADLERWEWLVKGYAPGGAGQAAYDQITRAIVLKAEYEHRANELDPR